MFFLQGLVYLFLIFLIPYAPISAFLFFFGPSFPPVGRAETPADLRAEVNHQVRTLGDTPMQRVDEGLIPFETLRMRGDPFVAQCPEISGLLCFWTGSS